jgi:hypothetical protein
MKKALSLLLALVLCLSLCACGSKENSNGTELTLDNYSNYLTVSARLGDSGDVYVGTANMGHGVKFSGGWTYYLYKELFCAVDIKGVSTNFNYNNISVTVRFTGKYQTADKGTYNWTFGGDIDKEVTVNCNIAGEGYVSEIVLTDKRYVMSDMTDVKWEVVAISGTVTPAS